MSRLKGPEAQSPNSPNTTFVTNSIPDISPNAGVVGLCTVPPELSGMDSLGWYITDFLAFKAILRGETHHRAQNWLAQCDISTIAQANPENYAHGKERRLVSGAATASMMSEGKGNTHPREDHIQVEESALNLKQAFLETLLAKSKIAEKTGFPLFVIVCGPTTLEQDVFFGDVSTNLRLTSDDIRDSIGNNVDAVMITPALFSAGWQINPSFCRSPTERVCAERMDFFARQFGGVFANEIIPTFELWTCPFIDIDRVDANARGDRFPGPVMPSDEQAEKKLAMKLKLYGALAGRLSSGHWDHSFNFDDKFDDWKKLVGPRRHKSLSHWSKKWEALDRSQATPEEERLDFLGNAFGGNIRSQVAHIKYLVAETMVAWPETWTTMFGRKAAAEFTKFQANPFLENIRYQEMFNIMEHRATSSVLADLICDYYYLPRPSEQRCRDWRERAWKEEASPEDRRAMTQVYREISSAFPAVYLPPGVSFNHLSLTQKKLGVPASYLSASLCMKFSKREGLQAAVTQMATFFQKVKNHQVKLLLENPEAEKKCVDWLKSINMPTRDLRQAVAVNKWVNMLMAEPLNNWPVLRDAGGNTGRAATPSDTQSAVASPVALPPVNIEEKPVQRSDPPISQSPRAVPASQLKVRTGPMYDHRSEMPAGVVEAFDRMASTEIQALIDNKTAKKAQVDTDLENASPKEYEQLEAEQSKLNKAIWILKKEARIKKHEEDVAKGIEKPIAATPSAPSQPSSTPNPVLNPRVTPFNPPTKTSAEEHGKPVQKPAPDLSHVRKENVKPDFPKPAEAWTQYRNQAAPTAADEEEDDDAIF